MSTNPLTEMLRPYVKAIKADAEIGNPRAIEIIKFYEMHRDATSDPGAYGCCQAAFDEWRRERP